MNLIEKLNKIDINDLQKIDYKKIALEVRKNPNDFINIIAVLLTGFIVFNLFTKKQAEAKKLKTEMVTLEQKKISLENYNKANNELTAFIKNLPQKITDDEIVNRVTDIAVARNVQIETFTPAKKIKTTLYDLNSIVLSITASSYKDLWLFVHDLEQSAYALRIDHWTVNSLIANNPDQAKKETKFRANLEITSLNIKNE